MQSIICRFATSDDLAKFNSKHNLTLSPNTIEYDLDNNRQVDKVKKVCTKVVYDKYKNWWLVLPEFVQQKQEPYAKIIFKLEKENSELLTKIFEQKITPKTKSIWFPALDRNKKRYIRVVGGKLPKYPIYVVSKGRADRQLTVKHLNRMEVHHYVVVEAFEYDKYKEALAIYPFSHILLLDNQFLEEYDTLDDLGDSKSKGPGAARNFAMCHAKNNGYKWCHILDDNIDGWHYLNHNIKHKMRTPVCFTVLEDFVERFSNVALAGFNYSFFCVESQKYPAFNTNTRIYSCLMCNTDMYDKFHWRGRYNEDTILSLDILSAGYCTILLNVFLIDKVWTQTMKGGNMDDFYSVEGTEPKTDMLVKTYPQYAKKVFKFQRIHHQVNYRNFQQSLKYVSEIPYNDVIDDYGMKIVKIPKEWENTFKDTRSYIENHLEECVHLKS